MTATRRTTDTLIIVAIMLVVWQILHQIAGETALPAPLPTFAYLVHMVPTARFAENAAATLKAFCLALILAYGIGLAVGVSLVLRGWAYIMFAVAIHSLHLPAQVQPA